MQAVTEDVLMEIVLQVLIKRAEERDRFRHSVGRLGIGYESVQDYLAHKAGRHETSFELTSLKRVNKGLYHFISQFNKEDTYQHGFDLRLYLIKNGKKINIPKPLRLRVRNWNGRQ